MDFCLSNLDFLTKFNTVPNHKSSGGAVAMEASSIRYVSGSIPLATFVPF